MENALKQTPLFELHQEAEGKMVDFAGYAMPIQYKGMGVLKEHIHCRTQAGLFDVSHMGQVKVTGSVEALEKVIPSDLKNMAPGNMRYTVLLNANGGIVDDLIVTRIDDDTYFLVLNAACKEKDLMYLTGHGVVFEELEDKALIALQGPKAEEVLVGVYPQVASLKFMQSLELEGGVRVSRAGYTGEDGFEISADKSDAIGLANTLLLNESVEWIGLGARDSLRLEAGLCLYGHDLDDETTPIEAGLRWVIQKNRREAKDFIAADVILKQIEEGTGGVRVGLLPEGRAPIREGTQLLSEEGKTIGIVTSGGFAPTLERPVAMGYIKSAFSDIGTKIKAVLRGKEVSCEVATMPFVEHKYKK